MIAIFFKHFDQECIFTLKYGFCKIFIKDIETFLFGIALFTYISARFNQNCMKTLKSFFLLLFAALLFNVLVWLPYVIVNL